MELKESVANLTVHGFGKIVATTSKPMRFIWFILMVTASGCLVYYIRNMTVEYLSYATVTKETTVIASILHFPAITICGPTLSKSKLEKFFKKSNKTFYFNESAAGLGLQRFFDSEIMLHQVGVENFEEVTPDEESFLMKNLPAACKQGLLYRCNMTSDVEKILQMYKGYCYRYNPKGTMVQSRHGRDDGISIILFFNVSDLVPWPQHDNGESVDVFVNNHRDFPFTATGSVLAPVGHVTQIELRKTKITRSKSPYPSNCTNGKNTHLYFKGDYTTVNCQHSCFLTEISKQCETLDFYSNLILPKERRKPLFTFPVTDFCVQAVYAELLKTNFASCNCRLPCHEIQFEKSVSVAKWPSETDLPVYKRLFSEALGLNKSEMTDDFVRRNFLRVDVYYGDMSYKNIAEDEKYSFGKLIGDIGGFMGLMIGASVFSLLELIVLLFEAVLFVTKRNKVGLTATNIIKVEECP